ncbi:hypothetical protein SAMN04488136_11995 [Vibrio xiamenensis]|uniref:HEAT repeat-containing protein n=1 Tax=Vibrio xiamenensis TaxID=861298 RepID=A0A1G8DEW2_9VIBR|nr:hypothetical protein [Vibrio xiamenensis]SDH56238.1 hypothetical protein SAMN04488136_11995 [Vibrio xiamenensis]
MQQGMLSSLLLSILLLGTGLPTLQAAEMQPQEVKQWLKDTQLQDKVAQFLQYAIEDEVDTLKFSLERLALPQQEIARYLLLKKIDQQSIFLTPKMALFVEEQQAMAPTYQVLERGDGYEFSVPAFNYPSIASRILKRWHQNQSSLGFKLSAERHDLVLKDWLSGSAYQVQAREALLISEVDSLSHSAITYLNHQLTKEAVTSWLPSSSVMVRLAQVSEDPELYSLLWRMRADQNVVNELERLARVADNFSLKQVMQATGNPSLKEPALKALTQVKPMSEEVKTFLIARMSLADDAPYVAKELASQGYHSWLEELANSNQGVKSRLILSAIGQ